MEHSQLFLQNQRKIRFQEIEFFWTFPEKSQMFKNIANLFIRKMYLSKFWARSEQLFSQGFYKGFPYKNFPWEFLVKWTQIKFEGNSLIFFSRRSEKNTKDFLVKKERKKKRERKKERIKKRLVLHVLYPYLRRPLPNRHRASGGNEWVTDWVRKKVPLILLKIGSDEVQSK